MLIIQSRKSQLLLLILPLLAATGVSNACAEEHVQTTSQQHTEETAHEHAGAHEFHPNLIALFVGVTHEGRNENELTLGIEYERRLNKSFGVGIVAEHSIGDIDFWVYAVPFAYHNGPWKFYVAPGIEDGDHGSESLLRLGAEYAFEVGSWEISPQFDVDFVDGEEVYVLGLTFGKGF
jgi:hypothetical protein